MEQEVKLLIETWFTEYRAEKGLSAGTAVDIGDFVRWIALQHLLKQTHVTGSGSVQKRYRCLLCGRDKFTSKTPHKCAGTGGNIRKRGLKWEEVE